jgi:hypothetical protein
MKKRNNLLTFVLMFCAFGIYTSSNIFSKYASSLSFFSNMTELSPVIFNH